jgi:hypothetical protein
MRRRKRSHESTRACQLWPCASKTYGSTPEAYTRTAFCPDRFRTTSPPAPGGCLVPTTRSRARTSLAGFGEANATERLQWFHRAGFGEEIADAWGLRNRGFSVLAGWVARRHGSERMVMGEVAFQAAVLHAAAQVAAAARAHAWRRLAGEGALCLSDNHHPIIACCLPVSATDFSHTHVRWYHPPLLHD